MPFLRPVTRRMATGAVIAALVATPFLLRDDEPGGDERPSLAERVLNNVNRARVRNDLPKLRFSLSLSRAARRWSAHLYATGKFEHDDTILGPYRQAGEVLARGYDHPVRPWLNSPGHRAIILASWGKVGGFGHVGKIWTGRVARP